MRTSSMKRKKDVSFRLEVSGLKLGTGMTNSYSRSEVEVQLFFLDVGEQRERHRLRPEQRGSELDDVVARDRADVADDLIEGDRALEVDLVLGDIAHPGV